MKRPGNRQGNRQENSPKYIQEYSPENRQLPPKIKIEKQKARNLRNTTWWKQKINIGICYYCKKNINPQDLTMDHVVPLAKGGLTIKTNLVTACKNCNNEKKNSLYIFEWEKL